MCWFRKKMVPGNVILLLLYQEEGREERVGREEGPLPLAGRLAEHYSGCTEFRQMAILEQSCDSYVSSSWNFQLFTV